MDKKDQTEDQQIESEETLEEQSPSGATEEEQVEEAEEQPAEEAPEEPEQPQEQPSRRENLRIQQLVSKLRQQPPTPQQRPETLDYSQALEADPEVIKQLEADREAYAQGRQADVEQRIQSIQWNTQLEIDAPKVESKYPQLDKDSEKFNPALADAVNNWYLGTVGYNPQTKTVSNPNVRYSEFVESFMELAEEAASEKAARSSKNIAKQAASTGLRPDGSSAKRLNLNQAPENMTDEELDAIIATSLPKK